MSKENSHFKIDTVQKSKKNRSKRSRSKVVWATCIAALLLLLAGGFVSWKVWAGRDKQEVVIAKFDARSDVEDAKISKQQIDDYVVAPEKPRYMSIPALGIQNARVQELGVKANNQLDDPKSVHDAGWYKKSALPGSGTSAGLYDGHNTGQSERGIFWSLGDLKNGDEIIIERGDGQKFTYTVAEVEKPLLDDVDMAKMLQPVDSNKEGLNIITCSGKWDSARNTFDHRTTVRAARKS